MADPPRRDSRTGTTGNGGRDDSGVSGPPGGESATGTPRWVTLAWIAALIVVVLLAAMMLLGGGRHGPSMHTGAGAAGGMSPSSASAGAGTQALVGGSPS